MARPLKTQSDAAAELVKLGNELHDPVMPVSHLVAALKSWCECVLAHMDRSGIDHPPEWFAVVDSMKTVLASAGESQIDLPVPLRDAVVADRLEALSSFYGEPVRPLQELCGAVTTWLRSKIDPIFEATRPSPVLSVQLDIGKSNLLWRLLYAGEKVRTKRCPLHNGRWYGVEDDCPHRCGGTGWLPEP